MQTVILTKKQSIAKMSEKRIDRITMEWQLFDQKDNVILSLPVYSPQKKDQFGRYKEDFKLFAVVVYAHVKPLN